VHRNKVAKTAPGQLQAGIDFNILLTRRFTMFQAPEQFVALNKANLEAAVRFAGIALEGAERMLELQLKTAKSAFADGVQQAKAFTEIKDVQELAQLKNTLAQPTMEKATSYVKSVYDVAATTQTEINKLVEEQVAEFNKQVVTSLDKVVKSAPAGSEVAVAAVKSAITAVNSAYDNLSKSAKQFAEMTQANVEAATTQAVHATKKKAA
jgi:phasin family protein